ncbi:MAG: hypothetical protein HC913_23805 [Microscillaceae bacterium]|nr:hypothetical protein [Microscillaceae bacterium]
MKRTVFLRFLIIFLPLRGLVGFLHAQTTPEIETRVQIGHTDMITQVLLLPDAKTFLSASQDKRVKHWDIASGKEIHTFTGHTDLVSHILLLPDHSSFLSASWDNTIKLWDIATGKEIHTFTGHTDLITQILLLPDKQSFLSASDDQSVKHWNLSTGKEIQTFAGASAPILLLPDGQSFWVPARTRPSTTGTSPQARKFRLLPDILI